MKARPHGASVVPTVATATRTASRVNGMLGDHGALRGLAPGGMGEDAGEDVGDEDGAEREQDMLDVAERAAQHQQRDPRPQRAGRVT